MYLLCSLINSNVLTPPKDSKLYPVANSSGKQIISAPCFPKSSILMNCSEYGYLLYINK